MKGFRHPENYPKQIETGSSKSSKVWKFSDRTMILVGVLSKFLFFAKMSLCDKDIFTSLTKTRAWFEILYVNLC